MSNLICWPAKNGPPKRVTVMTEADRVLTELYRARLLLSEAGHLLLKEAREKSQRVPFSGKDLDDMARRCAEQATAAQAAIAKAGGAA